MQSPSHMHGSMQIFNNQFHGIRLFVWPLICNVQMMLEQLPGCPEWFLTMHIFLCSLLILSHVCTLSINIHCLSFPTGLVKMVLGQSSEPKCPVLATTEAGKPSRWSQQCQNRKTHLRTLLSNHRKTVIQMASEGGAQPRSHPQQDRSNSRACNQSTPANLNSSAT
jgi:hypothetical protein